jgi:MerR family transcriptional regulator, light-induced transcriptional regulator
LSSTTTPATGLNIAALSRRTGVAPDTLRKWEQRYAILQPRRTPGGQRRYDENDVARVEWLRDRLGEGYRIGEAAALLGGSDQRPAARPKELREALFEAISGGRADEVGRLLDQTFALARLEAALREVVEPVLERVGTAWESGGLTVAQEHLFSAEVRARLERLLADSRADVRGTAVLACVAGERHELGLLMLAALLRADGWQVAYLGPDTPVRDALALAERAGARLLCLSAAMPDRLTDLETALRGVKLPPDLSLVLGGAAVTPAKARKLRAVYANGDLREAVKTLRKLAA